MIPSFQRWILLRLHKADGLSKDETWLQVSSELFQFQSLQGTEMNSETMDVFIFIVFHVLSVFDIYICSIEGIAFI